MRIAILLFVIIAVVVVVVARMAASNGSRNRPADQPEPVDAEHTRKPPQPGEDPSPSTPSGDPVPGSRADRAQHGKP